MFVIMQVFNLFAARKIHDEWNIFAGIHKNGIFLDVVTGILVIQAIITQFGNRVMKVNEDGLSLEQWGEAIVIAATIFPFNALLKIIPDDWAQKFG